MKLLRDMINRKLQNEQALKNVENVSIPYQEHLSAYLLALSYLGINDSALKLKKKLFSRLIDKDTLAHKKLLIFRPQENNIILQAINKLDEENEASSSSWFSLFDDFTWAILSYEHESSS